MGLVGGVGRKDDDAQQAGARRDGGTGRLDGAQRLVAFREDGREAMQTSRAKVARGVCQ